MASNFFPTDREPIDARLRQTFDAAVDSKGSRLFPDHEVPGTPGYNLRNAWLVLLQQHYRELNSVLNAQSVGTATGLALDAWGTLFDLPRKQATSATGRVLITSDVTGQALETLLGTRTFPEQTLIVGAGERFRTTEEVEIPLTGNSVTVPVESERSHSGMLIPAGTMLTVETSSGLQDVIRVETITDIGGGSGLETDDQYRFRLLRALLSPSTLDGFEGRLVGHPGVSSVSLYENVYGPGTVEAFVVPSVSFPPRTLRSELEAVWQGPGRVYVVFPEYEAISLRIRVSGNASVDVVANYINNLGPGEPLILNAVETALQNEGALDAQVIGLRRGRVDADGRASDMRTLTQVTNLTLNERSKWCTTTDWIVLCD